MALYSHHLILLCLVSLALYCSSQTLTLSGTSAQFLQAHNVARKAVGMPPLKWNSTLSQTALALAREVRNRGQCTKPSFPSNAWYNMLSATPKYDEEVPAMMQRWVALKEHYNYAKNKCDDPKWNKCDVYLQIVQKSALEVGCSRVSCTNRTGRIAVCLYYPPGNFTGVRPY